MDLSTVILGAQPQYAEARGRESGTLPFDAPSSEFGASWTFEDQRHSSLSEVVENYVGRSHYGLRFFPFPFR